MAVRDYIIQLDRHYYKGDNDLIFKTRTLRYMPYVMSDANFMFLISNIKRELTPDLLKPEYRKKNLDYPLFGHSYHATQALYYFFDIQPPGSLKIFKAKDDEGYMHWWLKRYDKIYDVTKDYYFSNGKEPPYKNGVESEWKGPKKRPLEETLNLMIKVIKNQPGGGHFADYVTYHEHDVQVQNCF